MKDCNGRDIRLGDRVKLWKGQYGTVVCSIDHAEYSAAYPEAAWSYLKSGVLVRSDSQGLFHYTEPDEDLEFIRTGAEP